MPTHLRYGLADRPMVPRPRVHRILAISLTLLLSIGVIGEAHGVAPATVEELRARIEARREHLAELPMAITGVIVDEAGPVPEAVITVGGRQAETGTDGVFVLRGLRREHALVEIHGTNHVGRVVAVEADQPAGVSLVDLGTVSLARRRPDTTAIAFGGDLSLGRRYLDPTGGTARDEFPPNLEEATIRVDHARNDTLAVLADAAKILEPYDLRSVNLETVVTDDPSEPQASQRYVFFTLPESAAAVADIGIDYVSLGNNHVWDYGTAGVRDTIRHLDGLSISHSGSGMNVEEAFEPATVPSPSGTDFVMHSWVATRPDDEFYAQHATASRAGGANASDRDRVIDALATSQRDDAVSVAHVHTGIEYTSQPVEWDPDRMVQSRLGYAVDGGADLVVAHHPHVAQGYAFAGDVLVAHSLGNLAFDQDRLDTRYGALLSTIFDGAELRSARVDPIHIADYRPTLAVGEPADLALRSWSLAGDADVVLVPDGSGARIMRRHEAVRATRSVTVPLRPDASGHAYLDLRDLRLPGESLGHIDGLDPATISLGRDLMLYGGMEDLDLDDVPNEVTGWSYGSSTIACPTEARRGSGALCSFRSPGNAGPSTIRFDARIRVEGDRINQPNHDLSLLLWEAALERGDLSVDATWTVSQGSTDFGTHEIARMPERNGDWLAHWISIPTPDLRSDVDLLEPLSTVPLTEEPRALRLSIRHDPPTFAEGYAVLDDAALISWHSATDVALATTSDGRFLTPSPFDFIRVTGLEPARSAVPTTITIEFDHWSWPEP